MPFVDPSTHIGTKKRSRTVENRLDTRIDEFSAASPRETDQTLTATSSRLCLVTILNIFPFTGKADYTDLDVRSNIVRNDVYLRDLSRLESFVTNILDAFNETIKRTSTFV